MGQFGNFLQIIEEILWSYIGIFLILVCGLYFSFKSNFKQIFGLKRAFSFFLQSINKEKSQNVRGSSVVEVFFASLGSCFGVGNIVSIAVAIQIGGPGALLWIWLVAFLGMIIKYAEVYLGLRFRVENRFGGYDGGPMYFLRYAFPKWPILSFIMAFLMCIYGTEIFLFGVIKESITENFNISPILVVCVLLFLVIFSVVGGVKRVGQINSWLLPFFILIYLCMIGYILAINYDKIPLVIISIFKSAFSGHSVLGGFIGSSFALTLAKGVSSACYNGDLGVGYASIINSETHIKYPERQASFAIVGIFLDTIIVSTATVLLILVTEVWTSPDISGSMLVQSALSLYFPYMNIFMTAFIIMLGFPTITAYLLAAMKSAIYISPKHGSRVLLLSSSIAFVLFSFFKSTIALSFMMMSGGFLILINIPAILILRRHVKFDF